MAGTLSRGEVRGVPSEVVPDIDDGMKGRGAVNLHNAVTVAQARLGRRVGALSAQRMQEICAAVPKHSIS